MKKEIKSTVSIRSNSIYGDTIFFATQQCFNYEYRDRSSEDTVLTLTKNNIQEIKPIIHDNTLMIRVVLKNYLYYLKKEIKNIDFSILKEYRNKHYIFAVTLTGNILRLEIDNETSSYIENKIATIDLERKTCI